MEKTSPATGEVAKKKNNSSGPPPPSPNDPPLPDFVREAIRGDAEGEAVWRLYCWPGAPGRGEFMRLLFVATGTPYEDVFATKDLQKEVYPLAIVSGKPFFALPVISHGAFFLSQTPVIVRYMAKKLNGGELYPKDKRDRYHAEVLMAGVVDLVAEGHDAWHAINKNGTHVSQKEETEPFIQTYKNARLPKWLAFFEAALQRNHEGRGYFIGTELTYVDICIFHVLDGNAFQCPEVFERAQIPLLKAFHTRIASLPAIAAYLKSDQRTKFTGTGPIF